MNRKLVHTLFLMVLMAMITLSASVARADALNGDSLTLTLPNPINVSYGATFDVVGTITASAGNAGNLFLNSTNCTTSGDITCDDSAFYANSALISLAPGQSVTAVLFSLTLGPMDPSFPYGNYGGFFTIYGGSDAFELSALTNVPPDSPNFTAAVPEPASMLLLGSGLSGLVGVIRRKRQS